jgi:hypothetical protein
MANESIEATRNAITNEHYVRQDAATWADVDTRAQQASTAQYEAETHRMDTRSEMEYRGSLADHYQRQDFLSGADAASRFLRNAQLDNVGVSSSDSGASSPAISGEVVTGINGSVIVPGGLEFLSPGTGIEMLPVSGVSGLLPGA